MADEDRGGPGYLGATPAQGIDIEDLEPGSTHPEVEAIVTDEGSPAGFFEPTPPPLPEPLEGTPAFDGWVEADDFAGDGPFPVDVETAPPMGNAFAAAGPYIPRVDGRPSVASAFARSGDGIGVPGPTAALEPEAPPSPPELRLKRRRKPPVEAPGRSIPRRYPKLRGLLSNPTLVPEGSDPLPEPVPPPVPGTFIPNPPPPPPKAEPTDLDGMLALMADGLFIREGDDGATEIRVTLRDEFFAGTELRIELEDGRIKATLVPPSRDVYWQLGGEAHQLRDRLEQRGLRVAELRVLEPTA